jgi:integrase
MTTTLQNNINNVKNLYKNIYNKDWNGDLEFLQDTETIVFAIENSGRSVGGKYTQFKIICAMLRNAEMKDLHGFYLNKMNEYIPLITQINKQNQPRPNENYLQFINWNVIINEVVQEVRDKGTYKEKILLELYTSIPPRRSQLAQFLKLGYQDDNQYNYLDLDKDRIVLNKWKNSRYRGSDIIYLKPETTHLLKLYIINSGVEKGSLIFGSKRGRPLKEFYLLKQLFSRFTGFPLGSRALRHLFITDFMSKQRSIADIESMANRMGNTPYVFQTYNRIF